MWSRRIFYALLLLGAVLFQIVFRFYLATYLLVLVILLPLLSLLLALPGLRRTTLTVSAAAPTAAREESLQFTLTLTHPPLLPLLRPMARVEWVNQLTGETGRTKLALSPLQPSVLTLPAPHCGRVVCRVAWARRCDLLGLFPLPVKKGPEGAVLVLPASLEVEHDPSLAGGHNEGTVLKPRPGGGPGEDYDLRAYRAGDPLRSVHWKLSSKWDELVVRETLEPQQAAIVVTYDHFGAPEVLDRTFAQLCALSRWLLSQDKPHHIQWAAPLTGAPEDRAVDGERSLLACLEVAFSTPAPQSGRSILDGALKAPGGAGKVRHLHVTPDGVEGGRT